MVKSANFVILGKDVGPDLGKKGAASDIIFYDKKDPGIIRTYAYPAGFPDKIQPMIQAASMSEFAILCIDRLDRFAGEQIIALDMLGIEKGVLSHTYDVDEGRLESMVRGTVAERYVRAEPDGIKEAAESFEPSPAEGEPEAVIDQCFDVKGVGTVILGNVTSGTIKQYDTLELRPGGAEVLVKSMQMHDDPVTEAAAPARVGLAVKGARPDDVGRGDVLAPKGASPEASEIEVDFAQSPFYKGGPAEGQGCLVAVGMQVKAAKFSSVSPVRLSFERPIVARAGQTALVLKPESETVRIMGSGRIR